MVRILGQHPMGVQIRAVDGDRPAHHLPEMLRSLIEGGKDVMLQFSIQRSDLQSWIALRFGTVADRPARDSLDTALDPPAVQHAEARYPVERRLHAAGTGSLPRLLEI